MKGRQAVQQLVKQGNIDIKKINAQGGIDKWLQSKKGQQEMAQLQQQGKIDLKKIGAQGLQIKIEQLVKQGNIDISMLKAAERE